MTGPWYVVTRTRRAEIRVRATDQRVAICQSRHDRRPATAEDHQHAQQIVTAVAWWQTWTETAPELRTWLQTTPDPAGRRWLRRLGLDAGDAS